MLSKRTLLSLGLAATAAAQTTTEATLLLPDLCVTQSAPTVTVVNVQDTLTTYSYSCSIDSAAVSSASAKASQIAESAQNKASEVRASLATFLPGGFKEDKDIPEDRRRRAEGSMKRDSSFECYGFDAFDACIPWEITQGPSYWAVHYTGTNIAAVNQECTFGEGGVANGPATCTGSGRLDPEIWGDGDGSHTETFAKTEVDDFFIRNTVAVTMGGPQATGGGGPKGQNAHPVTTGAHATGSGSPAGMNNPQGSALGVRLLPTGAVAWVAGAGGILAAAIAL